MEGLSFKKISCLEVNMFKLRTLITKFQPYKKITCARQFSLAHRLRSQETDLEKELVITEKNGNIFMIMLNRPEKRNCVNIPTACQLMKAFQEFEADDQLHAAILYGNGGNFCSGFDLSELANTKELPKGINAESMMSFMGPSRMLTSKPVVGAINGYAVAGGLELALLCDLRVVEETAIMGVFCRRFGVPLVDGGTARLPNLIGLSRALDLILTGRPIKAKEAFEMGLANRITACGTAIGQAVVLARSISRFPQACLRADRKSAYYSSFEAKSLSDALEFEYHNALDVLNKESIPGARTFATGEGRHGKFDGNWSKEEK